MVMFDEVRFDQLMAAEDEALRELAALYVSEALFFDRVMDADLSALDAGARIAEVGAGVGLLSMLMAARGHAVTAYEPESAGFSEMSRIREKVQAAWDGPLPAVTWVNAPAGGGAGMAEFDMVVCINVLEHVPDTAGFLRLLADLVAPGGRCRVIFPNYAFPYEPHFNFPTMWRKNATWRVWRRRIESSSLPDPAGMWRDLSWPTMAGVRRTARDAGMRATFSREGFRWYLRRVTWDDHFAARKGRVVSAMVRPLARVAMTVIGAVPMRVVPIVDMTIES